MQSGFRPGDSTTYHLTEPYNCITKATVDAKDVRAVFCDTKKAFDRVWHKELLYRLKAYGINGKHILWFKTLVEDRKQKTGINGCTSENKSYRLGYYKDQCCDLFDLLFILIILLTVSLTILDYLPTILHFILF